MQKKEEREERNKEQREERKREREKDRGRMNNDHLLSASGALG